MKTLLKTLKEYFDNMSVLTDEEEDILEKINKYIELNK